MTRSSLLSDHDIITTEQNMTVTGYFTKYKIYKIFAYLIVGLLFNLTLFGEARQSARNKHQLIYFALEQRSHDTLRLEGFTGPCRIDRNPNKTGKRRSDVICVGVRSLVMTLLFANRCVLKAFDFFSVFLQLFQLPREFINFFCKSCIHSTRCKTAEEPPRLSAMPHTNKRLSPLGDVSDAQLKCHRE